MIKQSNRAERDEGEVKKLTRIIEARGIRVRREKLTSGVSFRVRSGECMVHGTRTLFVDKKLPADAQLTVLVDFMVDAEMKISGEEAGLLQKSSRQLLTLEG